MNPLTLALFALMVVASARAGLIGASGIVSAAGAVGPSGIVTARGAIGPLGAIGIAPAGLGLARVGLGGVVLADNGQWHGEGLLESQDLTGQLERLTGINDGQYRGEGLLESQDLAAHGAIITPAGIALRRGW